MIKLKDVAQEAGVALSTVSAALNGTGRVNSKRREDIVALANKMGYQPNIAGKLLKSHENKILGLVIVTRKTRHGHGVTAEIITEMVEECYSNGWRPHFELYNNEDSEATGALPNMFTDGLAGGCIFTGYMNDKVRQWLSEHPDFPVVSLGESGTYSVRSDNSKGVFDAVQYLAASGHQRISMICGPGKFDIHQQSIQAYNKAAEAFGVSLTKRSILEQTIDSSNLPKHNQQNLEYLDFLFSDPAQAPDALILAGRHLTSTALYHLARKGFNIPEDVSIMGMLSEDEAIALYPEVTAIQRDFSGMTQTATRMLMQLVQGNPVRNPNIFIETKLVHRNTTQKRRQTK